MKNICLLIEEADALTKRKRALEMGIIPTPGTNWKAALKNKKLREKAKNFQKSMSDVNSYALYNEIDKNKVKNPRDIEFGGNVDTKGNIKNLEAVGDNRSVDPSFMIEDPNSYSYHKHPTDTNLEEIPKDDLYHQILSRPSRADLEAYETIKGYQKNKGRRFDFVGAPDTNVQNVSMVRTFNKGNSIKQDQIHFANNASKYYDLNGNLKNKEVLNKNSLVNRIGNAYRNTRSFYNMRVKAPIIATKDALKRVAPLLPKTYKEIFFNRDISPKTRAEIERSISDLIKGLNFNHHIINNF